MHCCRYVIVYRIIGLYILYMMQYILTRVLLLWYIHTARERDPDRYRDLLKWLTENCINVSTLHRDPVTDAIGYFSHFINLGIGIGLGVEQCKDTIIRDSAELQENIWSK